MSVTQAVTDRTATPLEPPPLAQPAAGGGGLALAHDYLLVLRGAERTFASMADCWPQAPIHTLLYDPEGMRGRLAERDVTPSPLQRLGADQDSFRQLLPLFPPAARLLPTGSHDVLVSSSSAFAHGARPAPGGIHVCYCHSPFRYAWHERERALEEAPPRLRPALSLLLAGIRRWDRRAAARVTHVIANSRITQARIRSTWGRDAPVIHPPVDVDRFAVGEADDYVLMVGELIAHKRVEVALQAAERAGVRAKLVGTGPELERLRERYGARAEFLGRVSDAELCALYAHARAFVLPAVEEFGIAAVEAQASGCPVVAADRGGAQETVIHEQTGLLVPPDDVAAFAAAIGSVDERVAPREEIAAAAQRFSAARFRAALSEHVAELAGSRLA